MAYTDKARELRRCKRPTKAGRPCANYAMWGWVVCLSHSNRRHRGPLADAAARRALLESGDRPGFKPCACAAYAWPHRPGGGLCLWPDPPAQTSSTPAGSRRFGKRRRPR